MTKKFIDMFSRMRSLPISFLFVCGLLMPCASPLAVAQDLLIGMVQPLRMGDLPPAGIKHVDPYSGEAAEFVLLGAPGRLVEITLMPRNLTSDASSLKLTVASHDCLYSTDDGQSWHQFDAGTVAQKIRMPQAMGTGRNPEIRVRAGGEVVVNGEQRGEYNGAIIVDAIYVEGDGGGSSDLDLGLIDPVPGTQSRPMPPSSGGIGSLPVRGVRSGRVDPGAGNGIQPRRSIGTIKAD